MKITKEEFERLELVYSTGYTQLRVKDNFLLKKDEYASSKNRLVYDYLFGKPYIKNSGEPIDYLFVNDEYKGVIMNYFNEAIPFANAYDFPLHKKIKAIIDTDKQLNTLHKYGVCFNDVYTSNLLIDENGGHLVDFDSATFSDEDFSFAKFYLKYKEKDFDVSFNADDYKALISYFSLIYRIKLDEILVSDEFLDLLSLEKVFSGTSIFPLICVANKNMLLDCCIPSIDDFLPFILEEERVNYDTNILKDKVKAMR